MKTRSSRAKADEANGNGENNAEEAGTGSNRSPVDESAADELRKKRQNLRRRYKIQDVIQRRQVLLVQVVKEERGNKGAALTTYLSLAGRYCVLMPNTSHGGGISRKISNGADRKRLKSIMSDLNLPKSMGLIVRTAGLSRTKTEIKRDFDYLARLWDEIRERTLGSSAPALIYRDSDLIKRAIRDLYHRDISDVIVEGEDGYKAARGFMKLLMPSHVRRVALHSEATPLFQRHGAEDQLSAMYQPVVQLKSGGYLVINPTEALVSIDINSGRSTREHNIEQTAFATNLEAASEIARQLRLRDMAGLIVIDFIDMEQNSHVRKVEKAMKEALKNDRARIQVGRISSFGLMEMSRQRLRTGVLEASTKPCPHCEGTGLMRTASSAGLSRAADDRGRGSPRPWREDPAPRGSRSRDLSPQQEALGARRDRAALRRLDRRRDRRELRRRSDERRELGPAPDRVRSAVPNQLRSKRTSRKSRRCSTRTSRRKKRKKRSAASNGLRTTVRDAAVAAGVVADADADAARMAKLLRKRRRPTSGPRRLSSRSSSHPTRRPRPRATGNAAVVAASARDVGRRGAVAADSSPMVERPIDEEPPIAAVEAPAEPQPEPATAEVRSAAGRVPKRLTRRSKRHPHPSQRP